MSRAFKKYYISVFISNLGNACITFLLPIYILELTNSTFQLSIISAMEMIPFLILGLPFGAVIDKINIKKMMQICDGIRFFNYLFLFSAVMLSERNFIITAIYIAAFINGICFVFHSIAESTLVPYTVEKKELTRANSLIFGVEYATNFAVPILTGFLYSKDTIGFFFLFDSITFLFSCLILQFVSVDESVSERKIWVKLHFKELGYEIRDGFYILWQDKKILKMLVVVVCSNLIIVSYYNGLLDYMKNQLKISTDIIGIVEGIYSLGALAGALLTNVLTKKITGLKILIGCIGFDAVCRLLLPANRSFLWIAALTVIIELTSAVINIMVITIRQERVNPEYLGRINSVFKTVLLGVNPVGLVIGGFVLSSIGSLKTMIVISFSCTILFFASMVIFKKEFSENNGRKFS